jgi:AraC-like DNA-binding protein
MIGCGAVLMNADLGQDTHLSMTIDLPTVEDVKARFELLSALHAGVINAPDYVRAHFHEKFPARDIAAHCGLSRFQFSRSFHHIFGMTFREYLLRYRVIAACERLQRADMPVTQIAYAVGFHDGSYFARMFRRYTGMLPSQYARLYASVPANSAVKL